MIINIIWIQSPKPYNFESNAIIHVLSKYPKDQVIVPKLSFANLHKRLYRLKWYITASFLNSFFRHLHMISLFVLQKLSFFEGAKWNTCRKKIWFLEIRRRRIQSCSLEIGVRRITKKIKNSFCRRFLDPSTTYKSKWNDCRRKGHIKSRPQTWKKAILTLATA